MLALPPKFLLELEKAARHPFAYMEIDGAGQSATVSSEAEWTSADQSSSNVDYDTDAGAPPRDAGDVTMALDTGDAAGSNVYPVTETAVGYTSITGATTSMEAVSDGSDSSYIAETTGDVDEINAWTVNESDIYNSFDRNTLPSSSGVKVIARADNNSGSANMRIDIKVNGSWYAGSTENSLTGTATNYTEDNFGGAGAGVNPDTSAAWTYADLADIQEIRVIFPTVAGPSYRVYEFYLQVFVTDFLTSGNITVELDLSSANTDSSATISIDDYTPTGTSITYTAAGDDTGLFAGGQTNLGAVDDGSSVQGFKYYQVTATLTGTSTVTPVLKSIRIDIPDNTYRFSTLSDDTLDAHPIMGKVPGRSIKLDLKTFITMGASLDVTLMKTEFVENMLRKEYFRGLAVRIYAGMYYDGVTRNQLTPYFSGKVENYRVAEGELNISMKDASIDLDAKVPEGTAPSTAVSRTYDGTHMVDVILQTLEDASVQSRYIDAGSFDLLRDNVGDGTPAAAAFVVYRGGTPPVATGDTTITQPEPAKKLISELLEIMGAYLVVQENGRIQAIEYDSTTTAVDTWDNNVIMRGAKYNPALDKSIRNQVYVYYDWDGGGDGADHYDSIYIVLDATSVSNWGQTLTKIIKSEWIGGDDSDGYYGESIAEHVATREVDRMLNGLGIFSCRTSMDKIGVQVGDFITIDSDLVINPDVGRGDTQKFMVIQKDWTISGETISWNLMEAR